MTPSGVKHPVVSICLPVRNGEKFLEKALRSALCQDFDSFEVVISDNASSDGTEEICRSIVREDERVRYHRQPHNIGLHNNFAFTREVAGGEFARWLGDHDWLEPTYLTRCMERFAKCPDALLVTTQIGYVEGDDLNIRTAPYAGGALDSPDPVVRFVDMLRLLNASYLQLDPLYAVMRRVPAMAIPRRNLLFDDQVYAARLALAGRFAHVPEMLAVRRGGPEKLSKLAVRLGVPVWQSKVATVIQCRELARVIAESGLSAADRRRAREAVYRLYVRRQQLRVLGRARRLAGLAS